MHISDQMHEIRQRF